MRDSFSMPFLRDLPRTAVVGFCAVCAMVLFQAAGAVDPSPRALLISRGVDIVHQWKPHQHVYVKGSVGVSAEALDSLEEWMDRQAVNWVVLLLETAQGETYRDAEGENFEGVEAVNHALGKGLINQTAFGQQTDPRTREQNAAFFLLFLKERQLSYYGSEAQDRRGLGEDHWIGNLDREAVQAMRNGARVVDAARETIKSIDAGLARAIATEADASRQKIAEQAASARRVQEQALAALANARADYTLLEARAGDLSRQALGADGDLARPDLANLLAELKLAQAAFDEGDAAAASRGAESVRKRAGTWVAQIDQYPRDREQLEALARQLDRYQQQSNLTAAVGQLQAARQALAAARREYDRADSSYVILLQTAARSVSAAGTAISMAERMAQQRRILGLMGLLTLALGVGVAGLVLNRRRQSVWTDAHQLFSAWERALGEKTSALFSLLDRRAVIVGTSEVEAAQRFAGETLRLCRQIVQDVDELFIMSACAGRVLQRAGTEVLPEPAWRKFLNLFRQTPYRRAIALLRQDPITFKPEEGLELVVRGNRTERDRLIGGLAEYQPFTMTFEELIAAFNERAGRALTALETVESSLSKAPSELRETQLRLDEAAAQETALLGDDPDGLFRVAPAFNALIPSAREALSEALRVGIHDPVGALSQEGARAAQQTSDACALIQCMADFKVRAMPVVREHLATLAQAGVNTAWFLSELQQLSSQADRVAGEAVLASAMQAIADLRNALFGLERGVSRAASLDEKRRGSALAQIRFSTASIDEARRLLGAALGLPPGETLREPGKDPTELVSQAESQRQAALAAIERGDMDATERSLAAVELMTSQADSLVADSREALSSFAGMLDSLHAELDQVTRGVPAHERILSELETGYRGSVLILGAGDPAHPNANGTVADNIDETRNHLAAALGKLDQSAAAHRRAGVLESVDLCTQAEAHLQCARFRLAEVDEKKKRLEDTEAGNLRQLAGLEQAVLDCRSLAAQSTAMAPTRLVFDESVALLEKARLAVVGRPGDPFDAAACLQDLDGRLKKVAEMARCDRDLFEQAGRGLAAASAQLAETGGLVDRAARDSIADSAAIQEASKEFQNLSALQGEIGMRYREPHQDWAAIDEAASQVSAKAATASAILRGQLELAGTAVSAISTAAAAVRSAGGWSGGFGVAILGAPGSDLLDRARASLAHGDYDSAQRSAHQARGVAERAIAAARAEEDRLRRLEQERLERERRRRREEEASHQRRQNSSFGSGGGSSWNSSRSGTSTSSFRSGSGVKTSSW